MARTRAITISNPIIAAFTGTVLLCSLARPSAAFDAGPWSGVQAMGHASSHHQGAMQLVTTGATTQAPDLDEIIRPITTVAHLADGTTATSVGTGFIVGRRYFTVYHNLVISGADIVRTVTYLDGIAMRPTFASEENDLAVFDLPRQLCGNHCNSTSLPATGALNPDQRVHWLRKIPGERRWRSGRILNYAFLGDSSLAGGEDAHACDRNVIVEVDTPFITGSSGSPVIDSASGRIIGIVQGSLERSGKSSGFFKPIECATRLVERSTVHF